MDVCLLLSICLSVVLFFACVFFCPSAKTCSLRICAGLCEYLSIIFIIWKDERLLLCIDCCHGKRFKIINKTVNTILFYFVFWSQFSCEVMNECAPIEYSPYFYHECILTRQTIEFKSHRDYWRRNASPYNCSSDGGKWCASPKWGLCSTGGCQQRAGMPCSVCRLTCLSVDSESLIGWRSFWEQHPRKAEVA